MDYTGKVVIVTGASSGIGYETARAFADRGATVVGVARRRELLERLMEDIRPHSPRSSFLAGDLGDRTFAEEAITRTVAEQGRLDVLVNNAGIPMHKQIYDVTAEEVEHVMRVNFLSSVYTTLAAIPPMLARGEGTIVNVSSFAAKVAPPRETPYTASKCAMEGFTAGLWSDLAGSGIHVGMVVPGPIDTEIWGKDDTPSGYRGGKHPPRIVVDAILEVVEEKRYEIVVPKLSPQLIAARVLRTAFPGVLRAGMNWMEPVPAAVIESHRARARQRDADRKKSNPDPVS